MSIAPLYDGSEGVARTMVFKPVGPVAQASLNDKTFGVGLMGPYGSAKTTTCMQRVINATLWQRPDKNGVRHSRGMIVRSTYGQLQTNVMEDWFGWFPKTNDNWNGDEMRHDLWMDFPGVGPLHIQALFRACEDEKKAESLFKGVNLTWAWLNEVDTLHPSIRRFLLPRLGRFPGTREGGCAWSGFWADMNAPDIDNWTYDFLVEGNLGVAEELLESFREQYGPLFGIKFYQQPGGLTPEAENLDNLPPGYYERLVMTLSENDKRRFVDNEFGAVRSGQPVYPQFINALHVADGDLLPLPDVEAVLALDGGTTPAAVLLQEDDLGQLRVLDELVLFSNDDDDVLEQLGAADFAKMCRRWLDRKFPKLKISAVVGDPAMFDGAHGEDKSFAQRFAEGFGQRVRPAPGTHGNRLTPRLEAVRDRLRTNVGNRPGILLSQSCKHLRRGFNNGYVFTKRRTSSGDKDLRETPDKNPWSHVQDALQYGVLWVDRRGSASRDNDDRASAKRARRAGRGGAVTGGAGIKYGGWHEGRRA
jgi:hypothetical protein